MTQNDMQITLLEVLSLLRDSLGSPTRHEIQEVTQIANMPLLRLFLIVGMILAGFKTSS
jgi:hypothetical protein